MVLHDSFIIVRILSIGVVIHDSLSALIVGKGEITPSHSPHPWHTAVEERQDIPLIHLLGMGLLAAVDVSTFSKLIISAPCCRTAASYVQPSSHSHHVVKSV